MLKNEGIIPGAEFPINENSQKTLEDEYAKIIKKVNIEDIKTSVNPLIRQEIIKKEDSFEDDEMVNEFAQKPNLQLRENDTTTAGEVYYGFW